MNHRYEHLFTSSIPFHFNGRNRQCPPIHQLFKTSPSRKTTHCDRKRTPHRTRSDYTFCPIRRSFNGFFTHRQPYDPSCRRHHPIYFEFENDFPTQQKPQRTDAPQHRTPGSTASCPTRSWPSSLSCSYDLLQTRNPHLCSLRSDFDRLGNLACDLAQLITTQTHSRMARHYCHGKTHGSDLNPNRSANVPDRIQHLSAAVVNYRLKIAYDGTDYFGWQATQHGPSIQQTLNTTLSHLLQQTIQCEAASRTDRGVHARGQIVQFFTSNHFDPHRLLRALNGNLPPAIRILEITIVPNTFHPTLQATAKHYSYQICNGITQLPFYQRQSWHYPYPIEIKALHHVAQSLVGTHDFQAFTNQPQPDSTRTIFNISITPLEHNRLRIDIIGDRFLYKMARTIAGTLANIGSGKLPQDIIEELFQNKNRSHAGITAPAKGLTLEQVFYPANESLKR